MFAYFDCHLGFPTASPWFTFVPQRVYGLSKILTILYFSFLAPFIQRGKKIKKQSLTKS
jgi:hypothetical protein